MESKSITRLLIIILIGFIIYIIFNKNNKSENFDNFNMKNCESPNNDDVTEDISEDYSTDYSFTGYDDINSAKSPRKYKPKELVTDKFLSPGISTDISRPAPVINKVKHCMNDERLNKNDINVFVDLDNNRHCRKNVDKFIDEYVEYGRFTDIKNLDKKSSKKDFSKFRTDFFDFERKFTNTNANGFDAVDRINEHSLDDPYFAGMSVGDIFDHMTKPNFDTYKLMTVP